MPKLNKKFAILKMKNLNISLDELQPIISISFAEYQRDYIKRHAAEKIIELIVEAASDVNRIILEAREDIPPETYYNTFTRLGELEILPQELSSRLASTTGLRNRLVHRYDEIDHKIVYHSAVRLLKDYRRYFKLIEKYLQQAH